MLKETLENRITAKLWSDQVVEQSKIDRILETAYLAPSKQGAYQYKIHVITDSEQGRRIKEWLFWEHTYCIDGERGVDGPMGNRRFNSQVLAPVLLAWSIDRSEFKRVFDKSKENLEDRNRGDTYVSASVAMCAAEELGLRTGFNGCLDYIDVADYLGMPDRQVTLLLGIGYADYSNRYVQTIFQDSVDIELVPNENLKHFPNAYELIRANRDFITAETVSYIRDLVLARQGRYSNFYVYTEAKCERDVLYVLNSYLHDLQHNSNNGTKTVICKYWDKSRLTVRKFAEVDAHNFIKNLLLNNILPNIAVTDLKQTKINQTLLQEVPCEPEALILIDSLTDLTLHNFESGPPLVQAGFDFANVPPYNKSLPNRKFKPSLTDLINYI